MLRIPGLTNAITQPTYFSLGVLSTIHELNNQSNGAHVQALYNPEMFNSAHSIDGFVIKLQIARAIFASRDNEIRSRKLNDHLGMHA
ncbi:MAG: hypothetical protein GWQ08_09760 [Verrucomicrobiaceae bacterium]|nr:hypothetical protein [Verrucomicrobiaceae bacterium]